MARRSRRPPTGVARPGEYFESGIQYYVAGRHAFNCAHYPPVTANLFHLGFEIMFKTSVVTDLYRTHEPGWRPPHNAAARQAAVVRYALACDAELRTIGHRLGVAWSRFKTNHRTASLGAFDQVVSGLDVWRSLRYPDVPLGPGIAMTTAPEKSALPTVTGPGGLPMTVYHLCLEELDELFAAVAPLEFSTAALRSSIAGRTVPDLGLDAYKKGNKHPVL